MKEIYSDGVSQVSLSHGLVFIDLFHIVPSPKGPSDSVPFAQIILPWGGFLELFDTCNMVRNRLLERGNIVRITKKDLAASAAKAAPAKKQESASKKSAAKPAPAKAVPAKKEAPAKPTAKPAAKPAPAKAAPAKAAKPAAKPAPAKKSAPAKPAAKAKKAK